MIKSEIQIIEFDPKYTQEVYNFVWSVRTAEIGWKSEPEDLHDIESFYFKDGGNFWLAVNDGEIVGTLALKNMGGNRGYLERMYLAKKYRGTGLAQKMLAKLISFAKSIELEEIYLATSTGPMTERAIAFYKKMGFAQVPNLPKDFFDYGENCFMKLEIKK